MITSLLIANRGEIACRIIRTCRRLGIRTVAVYSDADANARHVREADTAVRLGPAPAHASYLCAKLVLQAALDTGAEAIHPGYGFLSEKLEMIDACATAGIVFVGPHRDAIARMGSKIESKRIARAAGVPCVPGYDGDDQGDAGLYDEAMRVGFPLLIKASAGGGGKGMRRVDTADRFVGQLAAARAEAQAAFGDDRVLLERYVQRPRHLEVQLLGDRHGGLVHLFERECSIQRNYQKLIEEAPANHLSDAVRARLFDAALSLGRTIGYDSAGTVEFVLDADAADTPYFLEMNTRLQVEHPVTELTAHAGGASLDLVECQIRSACGEPLPWTQAEIHRSGWAIEARVNAEIPDEDYGASFGAIEAYGEPVAHGLRIDSGIDARSTVTPHYDAMLAKVIGSGATRASARDRLAAGVRGLRIEGVRTNQSLLVDVLARAAFDDVLTTRFLVDAFPDGWRPDPALSGERIGAAAAAWYFARAQTRSDRPLDALVGFRLTAAAGRRASTSVTVGLDGTTVAVAIEPCSATTVVCTVDGDAQRYEASEGGVRAGSRRYRPAAGDASGTSLWCDGDWRTYRVVPAVAAAATTSAADRMVDGDAILAEMPGLVARLLVTTGEAVARGAPVVVMEAMKLMYTLVAPRDGIVVRLPVAEGTTVARGAVLAELAPGSDAHA